MNVRDLITIDPEIMGGTPVFRGTRVPIALVFENLADGLSLDEIVDSYPTLDRADVVALLEATPGKLVEAAE